VGKDSKSGIFVFEPVDFGEQLHYDFACFKELMGLGQLPKHLLSERRHLLGFVSIHSNIFHRHSLWRAYDRPLGAS